MEDFPLHLSVGLKSLVVSSTSSWERARCWIGAQRPDGICRQPYVCLALSGSNHRELQSLMAAASLLSSKSHAVFCSTLAWIHTGDDILIVLFRPRAHSRNPQQIRIGSVLYSRSVKINNNSSHHSENYSCSCCVSDTVINRVCVCLCVCIFINCHSSSMRWMLLLFSLYWYVNWVTERSNLLPRLHIVL